MTRKEFEALRQSIEREKFDGDYSDPITYGIQRAVFEKRKLQRLIQAAKAVKLQTARTKVEQWKRQLERANQSHQRFLKLQKELRMLRPHVITPVRPGRSNPRPPSP
jgi:hypothetical protein